MACRSAVVVYAFWPIELRPESFPFYNASFVATKKPAKRRPLKTDPNATIDPMLLATSEEMLEVEKRNNLWNQRKLVIPKDFNVQETDAALRKAKKERKKMSKSWGSWQLFGKFVVFRKTWIHSFCFLCFRIPFGRTCQPRFGLTHWTTYGQSSGDVICNSLQQTVVAFANMIWTLHLPMKKKWLNQTTFRKTVWRVGWSVEDVALRGTVASNQRPRHRLVWNALGWFWKTILYFGSKLIYSK